MQWKLQPDQKIGEYGNELIKSGDKILTHCNAGALAVVDWGTALAPMRIAHDSGKNILFTLTRPGPDCRGPDLLHGNFSRRE